MILNMIRGFCMALADSVPGVSGGTVAFLLGFYDKFITSLDDLLMGNMEKKKNALKFLLKLGAGWILGFAISVSILASIFDERIYEISSLFMGFIIFAIPIVIKEEKETLQGKYKNAFFVLIGIAIVVAISFLNPVSGKGISVSAENLDFMLGLYVFVVAMVAISAMVLPGISGSTLLLIFGLYMPIISAVKEVLHFNLAYLPVMIIFGAGVLFGILSTIKLIRKSLEKFRSQTIYCIIGLMIGSLYAIVTGPTTLEVPQDPMSINNFSILFFIIGGIIIFGMQKFKSMKDE